MKHAISGRVVFLTGYIPPYALPVFQELNRQIEELIILVSTKMEGNRQWEAEFGELDVRVQNSSTRKATWRHGIGFESEQELHFPWDTLRQLKELNPNVVISEELGFRSLLSSWYQLWRRSKPLVLVCNLSEHTERGRGVLRSLLRKWLLRRATVMTVNGVSGQRYLRNLGVPEERLFRFPYVAKPGVFETLSLERPQPEHRTLFYCGEISERKGIVGFTQQLAGWCQEHAETTVRLRLVGAGEAEEELRQLVVPSNLFLDLMGFRNYHEIAAAMEDSSLMIFPTLADEWGLVVNEALAAGLPVVGSIFSQAVEELIEEGTNGWVFDSSDAQDTRRVIDLVMEQSEDQLCKLRHLCRESVAERTPGWSADQLLTAVRAALDSNSRNGARP